MNFLKTHKGLKRSLIIAFVAIVIGTLLASCSTKDDYADKQSNGLHYKFLDYIGPDSCKLYSCAYSYGSDENQVSMVLLTICKDKNVSTEYQEGKVSMTNFTVIDTTIRMVQKMVPETSLVIKFRNTYP